MTGDDLRLLEHTLELAERGRRTASPNPVVGCVIVRDGQVLGEGWHIRPGERHAETNALLACADGARGATAYVSLEPCSHHGRQPPCADALIEAGIVRVVCATGDPSRKVGGKGFEKLRAGGVEVELATGEIERRARRQNAAFRVHAVDGRPFVLLKLAASLDGRTATASGESRWISSPESRRLVHEWRASMDAVAVGSGTALADDPALDARDLDVAAERQPLRVVFDRRGRLVASLKLSSGNTVRIAPASAPPPPQGVEPLTAETPADALAGLGARGVTSLLVEGGAELAAGLLREGLVDSLALFAAPVVLGGDGRGLLGALGIDALANAPRLRDLRSRPVGPDLLLEAELRELP
jgi:diaminohydroxyphosphoribosylaminopyrimidine deaminase / 5-amino-6-(5-phosphoribosylamino)uracil reductase